MKRTYTSKIRKVIKAYTVAYPDPIKVKAGEILRYMVKKLPIFLLFLLVNVNCAKKAAFNYEYDYLLSESTVKPSKGTILLIHGQAPTNIDGRIPAEGDSKYTKIFMFRDLAKEFNARGWDVVRYGKYGVYSDRIDYDKYRKTDLKFTVAQLNNVWEKIPKDKPIIVFALSEGTLHAHFVPLKEASAIILLGAVSNNIKNVFLDPAMTPEDKEREGKRLDGAFNMKRDEMLGKSAPAGRYVDEMRMKDNWTYYTPYKSIPILILHGEADKEVGLYQSKIWKKKLPDHDITVVTRPKGNHVFGIGDKFDANFLADTISTWLDKGVLTTK